jgi:DNA-binding NarL/FixJ family response regulator
MNAHEKTFGSPEGEPSTTRSMLQQMCEKVWTLPARRAIRGLLEENPMIELVGEAVSFAQTIQMTNDLKPQVILMDVHMKDQATLAIEDIKTQLNGRVVAMSIANDGETKALADSFGAVTLLDKTELADELIPTIEKLASAD